MLAKITAMAEAVTKHPAIWLWLKEAKPLPFWLIGLAGVPLSAEIKGG